MAALTAALVTSSILAATSAAQAGADPAAAKIVGAAAGQTDFFVFVKSQTDLRPASALGTHAERTRFVYETKKAEADRTQAGLRQLLTERRATFTPYWIANAIKVTGDRGLMLDIARRAEVDKIVADRTYALVEPVKRAAAAKPNAVEWNIDRIRAPEVWNTFGDRGEGIVVATIDTGAQFDHPAIASKYRGAGPGGSVSHDYNWFDPSQVCGQPSLVPCDNVNHGTHVMGTIVGDDGQGNQVGAAPGAKWIAAKGCESNSCSVSALLAAGQWMIAPTNLAGANPRPDLAPNVINNSWGGGPGDPFYTAIVDAWVNAGIFPVFAAGNAGPGCGSVGSPGDYTQSYAVGAFDINNNIAFFSSRGPSPSGETKPEVAAPGVNVRSSVPGGGYASFDGTSMATPHVTATVALIWSISDSLRGQIADTRTLIDSTAVGVDDQSCGGTPTDNNVWGHGRLDAFNAVDQAPRGPSGALTGTVRSGGNPLAGAKISVTGPIERTTTTNDAGEYQLPHLSVGQYDVTASAFGFLTQTAQVVITENQTTTRDFDLAAAPKHTVSGHVRDGTGAAIAGATVNFPGTPLPVAHTDADGAYQVSDVPEGTFDVVAEKGGCLLPQRLQVTVAGDTTVDFTLPAKSDMSGHVCATTASSFVDANTVLPLSGLDVSMPVELPFPVEFYGKTYRTANVTSKAFLSFTDAQPVFINTSIPNPNAPNTAIYAFWDDLFVDPGASVRTEVIGTAPNRSFVVEWRDVSFFGMPPDKRISAEIVLAENGRITLQYKGLGDDPVERGGSATVGIENQTGSDALEFSFNKPVLDDGTAIVIRVPGTGLVHGTVTDANDHQPLSGATVTVSQAGVPDVVTDTGGDGGYLARVKVGDFHLRIGKEHYTGDEADLNLAAEDGFLRHDAELRTGLTEIQPQSMEIIAPAGQTRKRALTITNTGGVDLSWQIKESGGGAAQQRGAVKRPSGTFDANARTAKDFPSRQGVQPAAPGEVLKSWPTTGLQLGWGVGYAGGPWISDASGRTNTHFTDAGVAGQSWSTPWVSAFGGDMAYVPGRNLVCQVNVGGDNGIHCWNPGTGEVVERITGSFPWTAISQRGLAYRADDDTFYVGGWNEGIVYHIQGLSHSDRGAVISRCSPSDPGISGLGWNASFGVLWEATNSATDTIYGLNPDTCQTLKTIGAPDNTPFTGAGIETDTSGNLWTVSQGAPSTAYLIDSGVPEFSDVPWLKVTPDSGTTAPGASSQLTVEVDTSQLTPGVYAASVAVTGNSGRNPVVSLPIRLIVPAYQVGVNAGGVPFKDGNGDTWVVDQAFKPGGFGYLADKSRIDKTTKPIAGTKDQPLYQNLREGAYEYRFDNVPNGTYAIELKFAEVHSIRPNTRLFDVIAEGNLLIPALDIAGDVGSFAALDHTLFVTVTDGQLNLRLISRKGDPIVNAIRVTQRPDRTG